MPWCAAEWAAADLPTEDGLSGRAGLAADGAGREREVTILSAAESRQGQKGMAFNDLLRELAVAHAQEVQCLRSTLARCKCGLGQGSCAGQAVSCSEVAKGSGGDPGAALSMFGRRVGTPVRAARERNDDARTMPTSSLLVPSPTPSDFQLASEESVQVESPHSGDPYRPRPLWVAGLRATTRSGTLCAKASSQLLFDSEGYGPQATYNGRFRTCIAYPSSPSRLAWDFIGAAFIFWDLVMIPMVQAFDPPTELWLQVIDWITLGFWTLNVPMSLMVGYVQEGVTVMVPWLILKRYFSTWLFIDLMVVVPDWIFTALEVHATTSSAHTAGNSVKLLRILRLLRMVRLLRLLKLRKVLARINEMIDTEHTSIIANICKMILLLLLITHFIACAWFSIGSSTVEEKTWLLHYELQGELWYYQYFTALHWSITQFTPASMEITPRNLSERVFTIAVVVFALVGFSYVVGSITGSLTQLRGLHEDQSKQFWDLRRYLKQNKVPQVLSTRIQTYLEHAWTTQHSRLPVKSVKILSLLSEQLTCELQCELYVPYTSVHPFFEHLNEMSRVTMSRIANLGIVRKALAREDTLFHPSEEATHMYIVALGRLKYVRIERCGTELGTENVDKGEDWIAESVLWIRSWPHIGRLTAMTESDLLCVDPRIFGEVISLNPAAHMFAQTYCRNFLEWLRSVPPEELSDISQGEIIGDQIRGFMGIVREKSELQEQKSSKRMNMLDFVSRPSSRSRESS